MYIGSMTAQVDNLPWAPPGATWVYQAAAQTQQLHFKIKYQKDTLFLGRTVKKMVITQFEYLGIYPTWVRSSERFVKNEFMYVTNDSVYWYNNNQFQLLYLFSATVGSTWNIYKSNYRACQNIAAPDSNPITIRALNERTFGNRQFTVMLANAQPYWTIGTAIIKNIGSMETLFSRTGDVNCNLLGGSLGLPADLFCYQDDLRGTIRIGGFFECSSLITPTHDFPSMSNHSDGIYIIPNPSSDKVFIKNDFNVDIKEVKIMDLMGQERISVKNYDNQAIDIAHLPNAMYVVSFIGSDNKIYSTKLIKVQ
jgi:hypothetical protein